MGDLSTALNSKVTTDAGGWRPVKALPPLQYAPTVKRGFDFLLALLLLPAIVPVILCLVLWMRLDGGPGLFGHLRIGKDGRPFRCWKIRTMVPDADQVLAELLRSDPLMCAEWAADQKLRQDPRVTPLGALLRRTSLDELPQIWNVLVGDMSLVGPRPVTKDELARYGAVKHSYLSVRPGITGLWQVSGRNGVGYSARVALDEVYCADVTFKQDLKILLKTAGVVLRCTGQ
ncbi:sugar transferase [Cognatishimia maritima]|uniref:Sugar transferase involved in LPS biosynthesis (Colanic, teichoic acid) n=1 Tax=Cognatishimia maritima TaxID=870908 RepID=A0A1M5N885_9RHOB|nr:sugar transferase [Cognatishimia maritima]SHG85708.1 Sugar transferase involved in LPS biosynthesis (colanic, teichoic acid) [Cognatishimia maritima]